MDGFFGIGFAELVMIAVVALIVMGPERLPGALREVAKFIRQIRNLSQEFTSQFGDEFKALEDLNPRRLLQDAIDNIDEEEKSKESAAKTPATKSTTAAKKTTSSAIKPTTAKNGTAKSTTATSSTTKPTPKVTTATPAKVDGAADATTTADQKSNDAGNTDPVPENTVTETPVVVELQPATLATIEAVTTDAEITDTVTVPAREGAPENQIAAPALVAGAATVDETVAEPAQEVVQTNGHAAGQSSVATGDVGAVTVAPDRTPDETPEPGSSVNAVVDAPVVRNRHVDGVEV